MKQTIITLLALCTWLTGHAANPYDNPDTLFVARDGTGEFRTIGEAVEVCRAFMEYHKVISEELNVNIHKITLSCEEGIFSGSLKLRVHDRDDMKNIISKLKKIEGLYDVNQIV